MNIATDITAMFDPPRVQKLRGEYLEMVKTAKAEARRGVQKRQWARQAEALADAFLAEGKTDMAGDYYAKTRTFDGQADARWLVAWKHLDWARRRQAEIQQALLEAQSANH